MHLYNRKVPFVQIANQIIWDQNSLTARTLLPAYII